MSLTNFVLGLFKNTWSGDHMAYQAVRAKGPGMQSYHRDMMKVPDGKRVVSVFAASDEDLYSVDGTDTVFLAHPCEGLPHLCDPIPIPPGRGDLFVLYSGVVHAGGCTPLSKPESWWRRVLFLGIVPISVTYSYTVGVHVPFCGLEERRDVDGPEHRTISGSRKKATKDCFSCGVQRLCATHEGELCPARSQVSVGSTASLTASAPQALEFPVGVTCLLPVLTSTHCLAPPASSPYQTFFLGVTSCPPSRTPYTRDLTIFYISTLSMLCDVFDQSCWQSCVTPVEIRVDVLALCIPVF